jgi:hypothetical protein
MNDTYMNDTDKIQEALIDEALENSFPCSDPPFYVGAGSKPHPTVKRKKRGGFGYTATIERR